MDADSDEPAMARVYETGEVRRLRLEPSIHPNRSIFILGMPGTGKSTLALIASAALGWQYLDTDRILSRQCEMPVAEYIRIHGEMRFRDLEAKVLAAALSDCSTGYVIACGGGICDRLENRVLLEQYVAAGGIAIHVSREKDLTQASSDHLLYKQDRSKVRALWQRRTKIFFDIAKYTFANLAVEPLVSGTSPTLAMKQLEDGFLRYLRTILCKHGPVISQNPRTYTILVDTSSIRNIDPSSFREATCRAHAVEVSIRSLPPSPSATPAGHTGANHAGDAPDPLSLALVFEQVRRLTDLPLIFSMRTIRHQLQHAGLRTQLRDSDYLALAFLCFRIGIEYLTLELSLSHSILSKILERKPKTTRIILSHCFGSNVTSWTHPAVRSAYAQAVHAGADLVRLELNANSAAAALSASSLHEEIWRAGTPPCITVVVGVHVQLTPIINTIFTPVAHSILACAIGWEGPSFDHAINSMYHTGLESACRISAIPYNLQDVGNARPCEKPEALQRNEELSRRIRILQHGLQLLHMPHIIESAGTMNEALSSMTTSLRSNGGAVSGITTLSPELSPLNHQDNAVRRSTLVNISGQFDLVTCYPSTLHNVHCCAIAKVALRNLSPINAVTCLSSALLIGPPNQVCRNAFAALVAMGFMQIYLSGSESSQISLTSGQDRWGGATPPKVSALSENLGTLQPTMVMVAGNLSLGDIMPSENPFGSFTGGTVVNLLQREDHATSATAITDAIASSSNPEGWVTCGYTEVEHEATAIAFRLLTGFACPDRAFTGIGPTT